MNVLFIFYENARLTAKIVFLVLGFHLYQNTSGQYCISVSRGFRVNYFALFRNNRYARLTNNTQESANDNVPFGIGNRPTTFHRLLHKSNVAAYLFLA